MTMTETEIFTIYTPRMEKQFPTRTELEEYAIRNGHAIKNNKGGLTWCDGCGFGYVYEIVSK